MKKETRLSLKKKVMKHIEKSLESYQAIPLSDDTYVEGLGDVVTRTISKEGNEYILYSMDKNNPGTYKSKKISKHEGLSEIEKHLGKFSKPLLIEELEYWKECNLFYEEDDNFVFVNSFLPKVELH